MITERPRWEVVTGAVSDRGFKRRGNEDAWLAADPVYLVADGMGGHEAGEAASAAVVEALRPLAAHDELGVEDVIDALEQAQRSVSEIAATHASGSGSTATGVVALDQRGVRRWLVFNIGDSRVYRFLRGRLEQVTVDHSVAQELVDQGELSAADVMHYAGRNVITRAFGDGASVPDYWLMPVVDGERLLLCSDGLSGEVPEARIAGVLASGQPAMHTAHALVAEALAAGGRDNVTVIVIDVVAGGITAAIDDATGRPAAPRDDELEVDTVTSTRRRHQGG